ncbi:hypothetical protein D8M04_13765 [Oceanobacillus piezotolerans]|uniref:YitT family protein n=1 Tax=Oceanobacillus piezotolerans TaxID=2448030 RepID=A0A498D533_9BACI|nr:YitT family protein [Oceanobacillus piezotolerans]RLL43956.1 hypothetical protein D8M04_13765 [Oceanobacillus piezotolerans]
MLKKAIAILLGSILIATGINLFVIPNHLLDGGIMGVGLIAKYALGVKPGLTIIILSTPLYLIAFFYNRSFFYNGVHGLLVSALFIDFFHPISYWNPSGGFLLTGAIIGGVFIGTGVGILLLNDISTGGTDLLALILSNITAINAGIFIFLIDCMVLLFGWFTIQKVSFSYSLIMVITIGLTTTGIISKFSKAN